MQKVIRKRARARKARLRRDGRMLGKLSFFESAQREVSSITGSVPHRLVETSDREWLSLELIGTPRWLQQSLIIELEQGPKRASVGHKIGALRRFAALCHFPLLSRVPHRPLGCVCTPPDYAYERKHPRRWRAAALVPAFDAAGDRLELATPQN